MTTFSISEILPLLLFMAFLTMPTITKCLLNSQFLQTNTLSINNCHQLPLYATLS